MRVSNSLAEDGFENIYPLHQFYDVHNPFDLPKDADYPALIQLSRDHIQAALALFNDPLSKEIFNNAIETHSSKMPVSFPKSPAEEQYFPKDLPFQIDYSRIVVGGADNHDIKKFDANLPRAPAYLVCIEPDHHVFESLVECAKGLPNVSTVFFGIPCALTLDNGLYRFMSANRILDKRGHVTGYGSRLHAEGETYAQGIALDSLVLAGGPTLICLDIEGSEFDALQGATGTLSRYRPDLAICVYHAVDHLWRIPLFIDSLQLGYKFTLRNYTGFMAETVLYASTK
jgi:FkbM family methyltransferase